MAANIAETVKLVKLLKSVPKDYFLKSEDIVEIRVRQDLLPPNAFRRKFTSGNFKTNQSLFAGKVLLNRDIFNPVQVIVLTKNLSVGTILSASMLEYVDADVSSVSGDQILKIEGIEERELIRGMTAGEALRLSDTRPAILVKKGDSVIITINGRGGLEVSATVEALDNGIIGQQISVRNITSGKIVKAIVSGKNSVRGI